MSSANDESRSIEECILHESGWKDLDSGEAVCRKNLAIKRLTESMKGFADVITDSVQCSVESVIRRSAMNTVLTDSVQAGLENMLNISIRNALLSDGVKEALKVTLKQAIKETAEEEAARNATAGEEAALKAAEEAALKTAAEEAALKTAAEEAALKADAEETSLKASATAAKESLVRAVKLHLSDVIDNALYLAVDDAVRCSLAYKRN